jgi:hypothetical protein
VPFVAVTPKCKHKSLLIIRTYDLENERALCRVCDRLVYGWRLLPYMSTAFYYRYQSNEDFRNGVVPTIPGS